MILFAARKIYSPSPSSEIYIKSHAFLHLTFIDYSYFSRGFLFLFFKSDISMYLYPFGTLDYTCIANCLYAHTMHTMRERFLDFLSLQQCDVWSPARGTRGNSSLLHSIVIGTSAQIFFWFFKSCMWEVVLWFSSFFTTENSSESCMRYIALVWVPTKFLRFPKNWFLSKGLRVKNNDGDWRFTRNPSIEPLWWLMIANHVPYEIISTEIDGSL